MSRTASRQEIEIKLRVADPPALRRLLKLVGAREIIARTHESNTLYDTPSQDLRRRGELIRVRVERRRGEPRKHRGGLARALLTYKAPIHSSQARTKSDRKATTRSRFKIREEAEVSVADATQMDRILRGLGLQPQFRYEKYRTTYLLPGVRGVTIELDETPVGNYLELEGTPGGIDRAALLLGYSRSQYLRDTYGALYLADCRRHGLKPGHMLFRPTKKLRG